MRKDTNAQTMTGPRRKAEKNWMASLGMLCWKVVRVIIIFGLAFLILKPFVEKISMAFMDPDDLLDPTVWMIPRHPSLYYWQTAWRELELVVTGVNTLIMSLVVGIIQMMVCTWVGYGLARFRFRGRNVAQIMVIVIMLIPPQVYSIAQFLEFRFFNLTDTLVPLFIMAFCGLGLKEGLYIYLMRAFFEGLPKDLENAAAIDGAGPVRTFFRVMLPNARNMMMTVFLFSFCWQWTDLTYPERYMSNMEVIATRIPNIWVRVGLAADMIGSDIARNAACIIILIPLVILFIFCQKLLIQGISTSGQANM